MCCMLETQTKNRNNNSKDASDAHQLSQLELFCVFCAFSCCKTTAMTRLLWRLLLITYKTRQPESVIHTSIYMCCTTTSFVILIVARTHYTMFFGLVPRDSNNINRKKTISENSQQVNELLCTTRINPKHKYTQKTSPWFLLSY